MAAVLIQQLLSTPYDIGCKQQNKNKNNACKAEPSIIAPQGAHDDKDEGTCYNEDGKGYKGKGYNKDEGTCYNEDGKGYKGKASTPAGKGNGYNKDGNGKSKGKSKTYNVDHTYDDRIPSHWTDTPYWQGFLAGHRHGKVYEDSPFWQGFMAGKLGKAAKDGQHDGEAEEGEEEGEDSKEDASSDDGGSDDGKGKGNGKDKGGRKGGKSYNEDDNGGYDQIGHFHMNSGGDTGGDTGGNEDDQPIAKFLMPKQPATKPPQAAILRYEASCRAKAKAAAGPAMSTKKAKTIIPWGSRSSSRSRSPKEASNRWQSPQQP